MTVRLTSPVLGQAVGFAYTGPLESWALHEGYATSAAAVPDAWLPDADGVLGGAVPTVAVTPTAAVLTAAANAAATVGTNGTVDFGTKDGVLTSVALLIADTAAGAAAKIDTALTGLADAAIVASKLKVTSVAIGTTAYVTVVGGTAAVLTALGVAVDDVAYGGDGRPTGASNLGAQADVPDNDPTDAENRVAEKPYWPTTPDRDATIANDVTNLTLTKNPNTEFDFDAAGVDDDAPAGVVLTPATGVAAGGTVVTITGTTNSLQGVTSVTFGGTAGTALDVANAANGSITVTTPVGVAGAKDVVLVDAAGNTTLAGGYLYV